MQVLVATAGNDSVLNLWSVRSALEEARRIAADAAASGAAGAASAPAKKKKKKRRRSKFESVRAALAPAAVLVLPEPADRIMVLDCGAGGSTRAGAGASMEDGEESDDEDEVGTGGVGYLLVASLRGGGTHVVSVGRDLTITGDAPLEGLGAPVRAVFLRGDALVVVTGSGASPSTKVVPVFSAGGGGGLAGSSLRPAVPAGEGVGGAA